MVPLSKAFEPGSFWGGGTTSSVTICESQIIFCDPTMRHPPAFEEDGAMGAREDRGRNFISQPILQ